MPRNGNAWKSLGSIYLDLQPGTLLPSAWFCAVIGDTDRAGADMKEAWETAERGPLRVHRANILLNRSRCLLRKKYRFWRILQRNLARVEERFNKCDCRRRDEEPAGARRANPVAGPTPSLRQP